MESNLNIKKSDVPKFNVTTVSSAVFGKEEGGSDIKGDSGKSIRNIHKTLSKLSGHLRNSLVRIKALEGKFFGVENKLISNIGGNQDNLSKSLIETNKILVGIQQQLALQSSNEQKEQKTEVQQEKREKSKKRLKAEESALEKTAKGIGRAVTKTVKKIISPVGNIFDKILEFITLLGAGIAVNAAFAWFQDPKNQEKLTKFFNILKQNWKLIAKILGVIAGVIIGGKIIALGSAIAALAGPLAALAAAAGLVLATATSTAEFDQVEGENAFYNDPRLGEGESFEVEENFISKLIFGDQNTQEKKEGRARQQIHLLEGAFNDKDVKEWSADAQKKYTNAIKFLKLDKDKLAERSKPYREYGAALRKYQAGEGPNPGQSILYTPLPENLDGLRAMGGPVMSGNTYLVGERGPEIFTPNVDGSVINNMKTEKIYQMISSGRKGRGGINMINLPPITNQMPPPEIPVPQGPATEVPDISSVNMADPYRQITPMLYGITV